MTTVAVDPVAPDPAAISRAADLLRRGEVVAFPTETVYGLGADATDAAAVERVYEAKGRPAYNPLIVHVPDTAAARALAAEWPPAAERLAERWWPGPLTLVVRKSPRIPYVVTAGRDTVALRVPRHPVAQALLRAAGIPLAAPSANRSGSTSPSEARHVEQGLGGRVPLILDGGPTDLGIESTVVDVSGPRPRLLRPGSVSLEDLEGLLGPVDPPPALDTAESARPAPGMLDRHYAPAAPMCLFDRRPDTALRRRAEGIRAAGGLVGGVVHHVAPEACDIVLALPPEAAGYARELYRALHDLDARGCRLILVEAPPATREWAAVRDRLSRASG